MIRRYITAIIAAIAAFAGIALYRKGRKDADNGHEIEELNEYVETRKRMEKADGPSDADVQRWLHERGKYKRDL